MAKYQADVRALLEYIGGKENIRAVSHCMTRMRFVLVEPPRRTPRKSRPSPPSRAPSPRRASSR